MKVFGAGIVAFTVLCSSMYGGDLHPKWMEKYRFKDEPYIGAEADYMREGIKSTHEVILSKCGGMLINHGLYHNDVFPDYKRTGYPKKIVITQKYPCFIVSKDWVKMNPKHRSIKKINENTVEIITEGNGGTQNTGLEGDIRRGLAIPYLKYSPGKIAASLEYKRPKKIDSSNSKIILGDSFSCLKQDNEETWKVYWGIKNDWVLMAEEKFYIKP